MDMVLRELMDMVTTAMEVPMVMSLLMAITMKLTTVDPRLTPLLLSMPLQAMDMVLRKPMDMVTMDMVEMPVVMS